MKRRIRSLDDLKERTTLDNGCWNWKGALNPSGYAWLTINGKNAVGSRVAWQLANGEIPAGMFVLHRCDNRKCVNPEHLFLGTNAENMADMVAKGRSPRSRAKLTVDQVRSIRTEAALPLRALAERYGVAQNTIYYILNRHTWRHV